MFRSFYPIFSVSCFSEVFGSHSNSFGAFCTQGPWNLDGISDVQALSREQLNEYIDDRTEFQTWEGMKTQAAEDEIIDLIAT